MITMKTSRLRAQLARHGLLLALSSLLAAACAQSVSVTDQCGEGLTLCPGGCVDAQSDPNNCGACGNACPSDGACEAGACVADCSAGLTNCNGSCVDVATDLDNCGSCGLACPDGSPCTDGACIAPCPPELLACDGGCVDADNDRWNCGNCGVICAPGEACVAGVCGACAAGETKCGTLCVDLQTNSQNCGGCGLACAPGYVCTDGQCANSCPSGQIPCNASCTDLQTNTQHCGACNDPCAFGETCEAGACVCPGGPLCGFCAQALPSSIPQSQSGSTGGVPDSYTPLCAVSGSGNVAYSFTAPADGFYSFSVANSSYEAVVAVLDAACVERGCSDIFDESGGAAVVQLTQGETVVVVVDGNFGDFGFYSLEIDDVPPPVCPTLDLGSTVPQVVSGTTVNTGDALSTICNFGINGDVSYTFTAPADGSYAFDTYGSTLDTVLHLRDGSCSGPEMVCNDNSSGGAGWESWVWTTLTAGQTVVIGVEGYGGQEGDFMLNVNTYTPPQCPMFNLPASVPQTLSGSTAIGTVDFLTPSCGNSQSPEATYGFTAPADGMYTFDTVGSSYDTVIHVRDATCAGLELACNDDSFGTDSEVQVQLAAGQTVIVVVDGYGGGNAGPYVLNIDMN